MVTVIIRELNVNKTYITCIYQVLTSSPRIKRLKKHGIAFNVVVLLGISNGEKKVGGGTQATTTGGNTTGGVQTVPNGGQAGGN